MPTVTGKTKAEFDRKEMEKRGQLKKEKSIRLYHGSTEKDLQQVQDKGVFGGLFAHSSKKVAESHGNDHIYHTDIPESKILTHHDLNYEIPYKKVHSALKKTTKINPKKNEELYDKLWDTVISSKGQDTSNLHENDLHQMFGTSDHGEAGWEAQRMRGQVAKHLGYHAVEMHDEHGTSHLIMPNVKLNKTTNDD
jgi:hypothetical protein